MINWVGKFPGVSRSCSIIHSAWVLALKWFQLFEGSLRISVKPRVLRVRIKASVIIADVALSVNRMRLLLLLLKSILVLVVQRLLMLGIWWAGRWISIPLVAWGMLRSVSRVLRR